MPAESLAVRTLRIFLSSPGDVGQERLIATRVIERLGGEFAGYLALEPILWEHEPLRASDHFQAQILPPDQCDICVCILWSRLGTRLPDQFQRADGSLYASGTEWEFENALESFAQTGTPDLMVYRKTAEPHASMSDEAALLARLEQKRALDRFIEKWFGSAKETFRAAFHTFDTPDKFETVLETHLRRLIRERLPKMTGTAEGAAGATIQWHTGSPFRGLAAFEVAHAPVFFGRTRAVAAIQEKLVRVAGEGCAFVLVFGMSGCGKSSLVKAGVLPTLTQPGVIDGVGLWRYGIFRPTDAPEDLFLALATGLLEPTGGLPELVEAGFDARELAALLRQAPERAVAALQKALVRAAETTAAKEGLPRVPAARFALVVDQLEEIFTLPAIDERQREGFVAALAALARSGTLWVLATMRADFYHRCAEIPELASLKEGAGQYDVLPASFTEIGQMIRGPARAAGLSFEARPGGERLDEILHEAAARDPEALPLLSFTLDQLFQERTERGVLTFAAYERLGGLEGALARRAEEVFTAQPPEVQAALPAVLRGLVTVGARGESVAAARRVPRAGLAATPARAALLDAFLEARLLTVDRADDGRAVVRVAHEALLRRWPRLAAILDDDRAFLQVRDHVAQAAARWHDEGRRPDFLLHDGKSLTDAIDMLDHRRDDLDPDVAEFIALSRRQVEGRKRRRTRLLAGVVGGFLTFALAFGAFNYAQWRRAEEKNRLAIDAIDKLTVDIPMRLGEVPGTRPVLRALLEENEKLLDRLGDVRGAGGERFDNALATGDVWLLLGESRKAEAAFARSETLARRETQRTPAAPGPRFNRATATARLGDMALQRGEVQQALQRYEAARKDLEKLSQESAVAREQGLGNRLLRALSSVYERIGDAHLAQGAAEKALAAFEKDVELARQAAESARSEGEKAAARLEMALAQMKQGDALQAGGKPEPAMAAYGQSLNQLNELAKHDPVAGREGGALLLRIGNLKRESGDAKGAGAAYRQSLDVLRATLRRRPDVTTQRYLADGYRQMGELRLGRAEFPGALAAFDRALDFAREVAQSDPNNSLAQGALAAVYQARSQTRGQQGDRGGALADYEAALSVTLTAAGDAREKASLLRDLGQVRLERSNRDGALEAYQAALPLWQEIKSDRESSRAIADLYDRIAYLYLLLRQPDLAIAAAGEGLARAPESLRLKLTEAHALLLSGQVEEARKRYLANRAARIDDRERFGRKALADFAELRAQGIDHPDFKKIEALLKTP